MPGKTEQPAIEGDVNDVAAAAPKHPGDGLPATAQPAPGS